MKPFNAGILLIDGELVDFVRLEWQDAEPAATVELTDYRQPEPWEASCIMQVTDGASRIALMKLFGTWRRPPMRPAGVRRALS